jgi:hypothetical protein
MPITHAFQSAKAQSGDATLIRKNDWNADHDYPAFTPFGVQFGGDPYVTRNPPAGITEPYTKAMRTKVDLTNVTQARVTANMFNNATALAWKLAVQYSADQITWAYLDAVSGPFVTMTPNGPLVGAWVNLAAGAKADVFLRWITVAGNGSGQQWHHHYLQVR